MRKSSAAALAMFAVAVIAEATAVAAELVSGSSSKVAPSTLETGGVACQTRAGWGDPYPSIIILKRLVPACDVAEVEVVRTNGQKYRAQCAQYRDGRLTIATATGDYSLRVNRQALIGDFVSAVSSDFSRPGLIWTCDRPTATAAQTMSGGAANGTKRP